MKTITLILLLLLISTNTVNSQKNLLCIRVLLGDDTPAKALPVNVHNPNDSLIASLTTDKDGNVNFRCNELIVNLDIRSNDLKFKSTYDRCYLLQNDTTQKIYILCNRSADEVAMIKQGMKKISFIGRSNIPHGSCPEIIPAQDPETMKEIHACLIENLHYPEIAVENDLEAKIKIRFLVDENDQIRNLQIFNGSYAILEEEALRAASCLSGYVAVSCDGKKVPTMFTLPLSFRLN
ncbi:energy transducer TonB [uncultured Fluviicola sp.]|uniref:energy transducer TonB n=1 Tax=uncultured Fluviicola sp. TaxID=463303 RepID=UPI0025D751B8|nr:energy transducer TonB [uncultured Fluviicola sp.]